MDLYRIKVGLDKWPINVECPFCGSMNLEGPYSGDTCWYCLHCKSWIDFSDFEEVASKA